MPNQAARTRPVLCVNPNAAIDKTATVAGFSLDRIHRPSSVVATPGGKGCNVARVLHTLGEPAIVTGWVGGYAGRFIEHGLRSEGIGAAFVHTSNESRTCLSIYDPVNHTLTEVYEPGVPVPLASQRAFRRRFRDLVATCGLVTLSGSLPPNVPPDFYATLIGMARDVGVPVMLDSSGEALQLGAEAGPMLIKPNRQELRALGDRDLASWDDVLALAREVASRHATSVVVSLGADGAIAATADGCWRATPPRMPAQSAVGSGDALLAGLAAGMMRGLPFDETLRLGIAAGSANTLTLGAGILKREDVDAILPGVIVKRMRD